MLTDLLYGAEYVRPSTAIGTLAFKSARVLPCLAIAGGAAMAVDSEVFRACSTPVTDLSKPHKAVHHSAGHYRISNIRLHRFHVIHGVSFLPLNWY